MSSVNYQLVYQVIQQMLVSKLKLNTFSTEMQVYTANQFGIK